MIGNQRQRALMKCGPDCSGSVVSNVAGPLDGRQARIETLIARDRSGNQQIHAFQSRDLVDDFVELQDREQRVIEIRDHANHQFVAPGWVAIQDFRETFADAVIKRPVQIGGDEKEIDAGFISRNHRVRRRSDAQTEWTHPQAALSQR